MGSRDPTCHTLPRLMHLVSQVGDNNPMIDNKSNNVYMYNIKLKKQINQAYEPRTL